MSSGIPVAHAAAQSPLPQRPLGQTGAAVTLFGLGGEGVLRTYDRAAEAVRVIQRALDHGVNYCDTAPAYAGSLDYYGAALGERRAEIFLASKTHDRTRDGSLRLLEHSLQRLRTTHLDLWQLHDLRTRQDLERIFGQDGALAALVQAREEGLVRFLGLTGHHDPAILQEAMRRFPFDTALLALNAADIHRLSFIPTALAEAAQRGMGVIGMKSMPRGRYCVRTNSPPRTPWGTYSPCPESALWWWDAVPPPRWTTMCALPVSSSPSTPNTCTGWKREPSAMRPRVPPIRSPRDVPCLVCGLMSRRFKAAAASRSSIARCPHASRTTPCPSAACAGAGSPGRQCVRAAL